MQLARLSVSRQDAYVSTDPRNRREIEERIARSYAEALLFVRTPELCPHCGYWYYGSCPRCGWVFVPVDFGKPVAVKHRYNDGQPRDYGEAVCACGVTFVKRSPTQRFHCKKCQIKAKKEGKRG